MNNFPVAVFGEPSEDEEDEEELPLEDDDEGDEDEELGETPPDVIAMLGFDPAEEED